MKSQQCHKYFLQYTTFDSERPQVRTRGRQTCFLPWAPSNLVTLLPLRQQSQKSRFFGAAMLRFHPCFFSHYTVQNYEVYHLAVTVSQHFLPKMSAFNSHMRQNACDRNWTFEDLLPCYCYAIKNNDRTIHSQALQPTSAGVIPNMSSLNCKLTTSCHQNGELTSSAVYHTGK